MDDTGQCVPESVATLALQQCALVKGDRKVQMFPKGTDELELPKKMKRYENARGVFHFNPESITADEIEKLSVAGRENEFLNLGSYSKPDIDARLKLGEKLVFVTEYTPLWIEVRSVAGTDKTVDEQRKYFEKTKGDRNIIVTGAPPDRVLSHLKKAKVNGI